MVCLKCGKKTSVSNSRLNKRTNNVWRRRQCNVCQSVFTTLEKPDYATLWVVIGLKGQIVPLSRDKLFISILDCVEHRKSKISDATALTDTILAQIGRQVRHGAIRRDRLILITQKTMSQFDKLAGMRYEAVHHSE